MIVHSSPPVHLFQSNDQGMEIKGTGEVVVGSEEELGLVANAISIQIS